MAASGTALLDFGVFPGATDATVAVTGQAAIVAGSLVGAWIRPEATAPYSAAVLADSPIAYWRLGEPSGTNANDEVGTLDGTYIATPTLGAAGALAGDSDTAVTFDGTSEYVTVPDVGLDQGNGPLSWECWFKKATAGTGGTFISKGANAPILQIATSKVHFYSRSVDLAASQPDPFDTNWHHVVGTKDGSNNWLVYLDGSAAGSTSTATPATSSTATALEIARDTLTSDNWFAGTIDEVAIYSVVLTSAQVRAHYEAGALTHSADEHRVEDLFVVADTISAGTGFTIYGRAGNNRLYGAWSCAWAWS